MSSVANPSSWNTRAFKVLTDYLEGAHLDQFLEEYPSVSREHAIAAIEEARLSLVSHSNERCWSMSGAPMHAE